MFRAADECTDGDDCVPSAPSSVGWWIYILTGIDFCRGGLVVFFFLFLLPFCVLCVTCVYSKQCVLFFFSDW